MGKIKDELGQRMKTFYEQRDKSYLIRRMPAAIRIDGKAFHTFTKGFAKPFDKIFMESMQETTKALCENIQGCVLGYTQSDEITLILVDYKKLDSSAYFDYEIQKICSVSASMATMYFNKIFSKKVKDYIDSGMIEDENHLKAIVRSAENGAMFDSRCFNIPKEEVTNLIYWRQLDASKNSVSMAARAYFSHSEVNNKNTSEMQEMLFSTYGINWNNYPTACKRGSCCIKTDKGWIIDREIPIFKGEDRDYIEKLILAEE